jgi:hypothetical protein
MGLLDCDVGLFTVLVCLYSPQILAGYIVILYYREYSFIYLPV